MTIFYVIFIIKIIYYLNARYFKGAYKYSYYLILEAIMLIFDYYDNGDIDDLIFKDEPWYQSER